MRTTKYFLVKPDVAERAGVINQRYHTQDGLMVLNEQDMAKVRLEPEEYLTGVVEQVVSEDEAAQLIEQAGRVLGPLVQEQEQPSVDMSDEEQTPAKENVDEEGLSESTDTEQTDGEQPQVEQNQVEEPEVEQQQQAEEGQSNE